MFFIRPEIFELFDRLKEEGKILNLGVSVEKVEEGLKAIEYPSVATIQIIFNLFRLRPSELLFAQAAKKRSASSSGSRWPAECSQTSSAPTPHSARRITELSTAMALPSTRVRPFQAWTMARG